MYPTLVCAEARRRRTGARSRRRMASGPGTVTLRPPVHPNSSFDPDSLSPAIRLQQMSYEVLRKLQSRIDLAKVPVRFAHGALDELSAARQWVELAAPSPPSGPQLERDDVIALANLFASYLTTSFDLDESPGTRL